MNTGLDNLTFWDKLRMTFHGKVLIKKEKNSVVNILTDIFPYSSNAIKVYFLTFK